MRMCGCCFLSRKSNKRIREIKFMERMIGNLLHIFWFVSAFISSDKNVTFMRSSSAYVLFHSTSKEIKTKLLEFNWFEIDESKHSNWTFFLLWIHLWICGIKLWAEFSKDKNSFIRILTLQTFWLFTYSIKYYHPDI